MRTLRKNQAIIEKIPRRILHAVLPNIFSDILELFPLKYRVESKIVLKLQNALENLSFRD